VKTRIQIVGFSWIPAYAGMTTVRSFFVEPPLSAFSDSLKCSLLDALVGLIIL
jgi:hypothetical protein